MRDISARELKGHNILAVERDWQDYPAEEVADAFEDISRYPFDGRPGVFYEV